MQHPDDPCILVLDDDVFTALDLCQTLKDEDFVVMGPYLDAEAALAALAERGARLPDAAVLDIVMRRDVVLGERTSESLARELDEIGVPLMFISGYAEGAQRLHGVFADAYFVAKPVDGGNLANGLRRLISRGHGGDGGPEGRPEAA